MRLALVLSSFLWLFQKYYLPLTVVECFLPLGQVPLIYLMLEFLKLAFAAQRVAQGAEEFLRLLNEVEEDGHAFNVEMFGLDVEDDALAIAG